MMRISLLHPVALALASLVTGDGSFTGTTTGGQQIGIAAYIAPPSDAWTELISYSVDKLSILIANVLNGPNNMVDSNRQTVIEEASAAGKTVIGYVRTGYLGVSEQAFTTRLGSGVLSEWVAQIESDVDLWYSLYPGMMEVSFSTKVGTIAELTTCTYMIESGIFYQYSGSDYSWSWTEIGAATTAQSGYEITWELPINAGNILIHIEGYVPTENFLSPCPNDLILDGEYDARC